MVDKAWKARVLTLFPECFRDRWVSRLPGGPCRRPLVADLVNIRDHATDRHRTVDDAPFGGGPGMVMRPDVVAAALEAAAADLPPETPRVYFSPLAEGSIRRWCMILRGTCCVMVCGRYEGLDQR